MTAEYQRRIFLFLGILPNTEPQEAQKWLRHLLKPQDTLCMNVNLVDDSSKDEKGFQKILPQYDNPETRDWLLTLFDEIGINRHSGKLFFEIHSSPTMPALKRIEARYQFCTPICIAIDGVDYDFKKGEVLTLFFSNRYTLSLAHDFLMSLNVKTFGEWVLPKGEEVILAGTFLP